MLSDPIEVQVDAAGVDHQQKIVGVDAVDQQVVEHAARIDSHRGILNLVILKFRRIVCADKLN